MTKAELIAENKRLKREVKVEKAATNIAGGAARVLRQDNERLQAKLDKVRQRIDRNCQIVESASVARSYIYDDMGWKRNDN